MSEHVKLHSISCSYYEAFNVIDIENKFKFGTGNNMVIRNSLMSSTMEQISPEKIILLSAEHLYMLNSYRISRCRVLFSNIFPHNRNRSARNVLWKLFLDEMLEACDTTNKACDIIAEVLNVEDNESFDNIRLVEAARLLLSAVTRILILADTTAVKKMVYSADKVLYVNVYTLYILNG